MNTKSEKLIDSCGSRLTYLWEKPHKMSEEELLLINNAIFIMLHVLHPKNEYSKEWVIKLGLEPLGGEINGIYDSN